MIRRHPAMMRKITPADRAVFLEMAYEFYHSEAVLHPIPEARHARAFDEMMRSDAYMEGVIFESDGEIAGYALLCKTYSQEAGGLAVWIDELYLRPAFRSRGMGKAFFAELPKLIPAARYRLEIEPDNARAEKLYRAMGFEVLEYKQMVLDTLED